MNPILEIKGLTKNYRDFSLRDVTFTLERGYIMGLIGPNGSGKSTTIKLIMNLLRPDAGQIEIFGLDHRQHERSVKERIGFVYDENHFYEELTPTEMKNLIAPFYPHWEEDTYQKYSRTFDLPAKRKIKELSKGTKMKYALAIALSHQAELIVMDEPTSGLDPVVRSELLDILYQVIQDERKAILFSTHITSDLDKIADYITFINAGQVVFSRAKDDIFAAYTIVKGGTEVLDAAIREGSLGVRETQYGFTALVPDGRRLKQLYGSRLVYEQPTLEEIMLYTVRRDNHVHAHS